MTAETLDPVFFPELTKLEAKKGSSCAANSNAVEVKKSQKPFTERFPLLYGEINASYSEPDYITHGEITSSNAIQYIELMDKSFDKLPLSSKQLVSEIFKVINDKRFTENEKNVVQTILDKLTDDEQFYATGHINNNFFEWLQQELANMGVYTKSGLLNRHQFAPLAKIMASKSFHKEHGDNIPPLPERQSTTSTVSKAFGCKLLDLYAAICACPWTYHFASNPDTGNIAYAGKALAHYLDLINQHQMPSAPEEHAQDDLPGMRDLTRDCKFMNTSYHALLGQHNHNPEQAKAALINNINTTINNLPGYNQQEKKQLADFLFTVPAQNLNRFIDLMLEELFNAELISFQQIGRAKTREFGWSMTETNELCLNYKIDYISFICNGLAGPNYVLDTSNNKLKTLFDVEEVATSNEPLMTVSLQATLVKDLKDAIGIQLTKVNITSHASDIPRNIWTGETLPNSIPAKSIVTKVAS